MGRIAKNYFYNAAYQLLVLLAPMVTAPYLARVLGADHLGIYSYVNSSGNIIVTISLLGIYTYGNRQTAYIRDNRDTLTCIFWELELTRLFLGIFGTAVYVVYMVLNTEYCFYFLVYYPYILAQFIDCSWLYVGLEDMRTTVLKNAVTKLVNITGIFLFVKEQDDVWIYIFMLGITTLMANVSIYTQLPKYIGKPCADIRRILPHLKESFRLFLPQAASLLYLQADKVMLTWITGTTSQVSFYDQAEKIVTIPLSLITVISSVMMPRIANEYQKHHDDVIERLLVKAGSYALCMAMPMMAGIIGVINSFIPWYLGAEFQPTATAVIILSPIIVLNSLAGISGTQYFTATNQIHILVKAYAAAAVMNVAINAVLIPHIGFVGAAAATVISSLCSVMIQYFYLIRQVRMGKLWRYGIKYLAGAFLMGGGLLFTEQFLPGVSVQKTLIQILIGMIVYFVYLIITRDSVLTDAFRFIVKRGGCGR